VTDLSDRNRFRFSIAWLMFWTLVCAALAWTARMLLDLGSAGQDYLLMFAAFVVWIAVLGLWMWWRIYARRGWAKVAVQRKELANLVRQRRAELDSRAEDPVDRPRPPD
jgi:hypothetical protein